MNKKYYLFFCLIALSLFSSCDDDEKETNPPIVAIETPSASGVLKGTVTITASATDESEISSIRIFIDETLLHETTGSSISFDWNTATASDGDHVIEVVASDVVGNEGNATLIVKTFNDKKAPVLVLSSPSNAPYIKSSVTIAGSIEDDSELTAVKIFIDDAPLTTLTNAKTFSFDWDTKTVADGKHIIRVSATDDRGNEASVMKEVSVFNYFLTLNVVNPEVPGHVKVWYLISKYDGTLIQAKPYVAGASKIQFATPDNFNADDRYVLTTFNHIGKFESYLIQTSLYAEAGIAPGEMRITPSFTYSSFDGTNPVGSHDLKIANAQNYKHLYIRGVNGYSYNVQNDSLAIQLNYYNTNNLNPYVALLRNADEAPRFKSFNGLQPGGKTKTDFEGFTPMVGNKLAANPNVEFTFNMVFGVTPPNYNESNTVWNYSSPFLGTNPVHYLYHPPAAYPEYIFIVNEDGQGEGNYFVNVGAQAPTAMLRSNATVNSFVKNGRSLTLSTGGTYDMVSISGSSQQDIAGDLTIFLWSVQFPDGTNHSITLPQLPTELSVYNFPDLSTVSFTNAGFTDYSGFNGYKEFRNFAITSPGVNLYTVSKNIVSKSIALPNSGGRMKNDLFKQTQKIMMDNNKIMGLSPFYFRK
jgi:hypothetical protein